MNSLENARNKGLASEKILEYVNRIRQGEEKTKILEGLPPSFVKSIEEELAQETQQEKNEPIDDVRKAQEKKEEIARAETALQDKQEQRHKDDQVEIFRLQSELRATVEQRASIVESIPQTMTVQGLENMKPIFDRVGKEYYFFTHQTAEDVAKNIFETKFRFSPGTGLSGTMSFQNSDGIARQIEQQLTGDAHRNYKGMFVIAVPKELLQSPSSNKAQVLEEYLMDNLFLEGSDVVIPQEFNFGYLQGDKLSIAQKFQEQGEKVSDEQIINQEPAPAGPIEESSQPPEPIEQSPKVEDTEQSIAEKFREEIGRHQITKTLGFIADAMAARYRETSDSVFGPQYQHAIDEAMRQLETVATPKAFINAIEGLSDALRQMAVNVEYGSFDPNNPGQEIQILNALYDDLEKLKKDIVDIENELGPIIGTDISGVTFATESFKNRAREFQFVLEDKIARRPR